MQRSNVEIYSELIAAFNSGGIDAALGYYAEDCEVYDPDMPAGGTYRGREGVRRVLELLLSERASIEVVDHRVLPAGDRVVALIHSRSTAEPGGLEFELRSAHVATFAGGKITYWRAYTDQEEALSDMGLDPAEALRGSM